MTESPHRKLRTDPGTGRVSEEAFVRGQALYRLMLKLNLEPVVFAAETGISLSTIWKYINGKIDLATARQPTVEKMLRVLNVTDTWAWQYFDIPVDKRRNWRTFRPPPLGHGDDPRELYELILDRRTTGHYVFWPNDILVIDRANHDSGVLLAQVDDQYVLSPAGTLPAAAQVIGHLVRMEPGLSLASHAPAPAAP